MMAPFDHPFPSGHRCHWDVVQVAVAPWKTVYKKETKGTLFTINIFIYETNMREMSNAKNIVTLVAMGLNHQHKSGHIVLTMCFSLIICKIQQTISSLKFPPKKKTKNSIKGLNPTRKCHAIGVSNAITAPSSA